MFFLALLLLQRQVTQELGIYEAMQARGLEEEAPWLPCCVGVCARPAMPSPPHRNPSRVPEQANKRAAEMGSLAAGGMNGLQAGPI